MAFVELDLSREGFQPIPAATYRLRIEDSSAETSTSAKNAGKPLIKWTFTVLSPERVKDPLTGEMVETGGRKLTRYTPVWAGAGGFLADLVRAAGANIGSLGFDTKDLHGVELMGVVGLRVFNEQLSNDIERFYPAPPKGKESPGVRGMKATAESEDDAPF